MMQKFPKLLDTMPNRLSGPSRVVLVAVLVASTIAFSNNQPSDPAAVQAEDLVVIPGKVIDNNGFVRASYRLAKGYDKDGVHIGIRSQGHGGGCLVTDLGQSETCDEKTTCPNNKIAPNGHGYCIPADAAGSAGKCWYKGEESTWCVKHLKGTPPLTLGERIELPDPDQPGGNGQKGIEAAQLHKGRDAQYRVLTCLNGYDNATQEDSTDCRTGGPNRLNRMGPIATISAQ